MNDSGSIAKQIGVVDRLAIGLSSLCLVHCVTTALLFALLASASGVLVNPLFHEVGLGIAILLGVYAFVRGYRLHGRKLPLLLGVTGLSAMGYALSLTHGVRGEVAFTIAGVLVVAMAHELNRRSLLAVDRSCA